MVGQIVAVSLWCCGLWGIRCKLYSAWAGKHADGDRRCNNSGGAGNINHRADRLRAYRVSDGTSLSGLGIAEAGEGNSMVALATISSGESCGRLFGPLCAAAMLAIHPLAPMGLLMAAPLLALVMLLVAGTSPRPTAEGSASLRLDCLPYLLCALLLAAAVSMMQRSFSALTRQFATDTAAISHHVAWLLGLAAVAALIAQFGAPPAAPDADGAAFECRALMICGTAIMFAKQLWLFYLGCAVLSFGAALATPAYQLLLNDKLTDGTGAGWIATSHTLGYGLCALLVPLVSKSGAAAAAVIIAAFFVAVLFTIISIFIWFNLKFSTADRAVNG